MECGSHDWSEVAYRAPSPPSSGGCAVDRLVRELQRELDELKTAHARLVDRHQALLRRRGVRAALAAARILSRFRRGGRSPIPTAPESSPSPTVPPAPPVDHPARAVVDLDLLSCAPSVVAVMVVDDDAVRFDEIIGSVLANTTTADGVVIVDDASTNPAITAALRSCESRTGIRIIRSQRRLGFAAALSRGISEPAGDVIIVGSSCLVPPRWVEQLRMTAYSKAEVASVSWPPELTTASAAVSGQLGTIGRLDTCRYLKRSALDDIGSFVGDGPVPDGAADWSEWAERASERGWVHLDAVPFDLDPMHGGATEDGSSTVDPSAALGGRRPLRALTMVHDLGGGTEHSSRDLARALAPGIQVLVARCSPHRIELSDAEGEVLARWTIDPPVRIEEVAHPAWNRAFTDLVSSQGIELVHLRQSMNVPAGFDELARSLGLPVVVSLHDFYLVCPTAHLIDESGRYCGGVCTSGQGHCPASAWVSRGPHLKHAWIQEWQRRSKATLARVDAIVAASRSTLDVHSRTLGWPEETPVFVIPHGRDLSRTALSIDHPRPHEPLRVLLAGTIGGHKGNGVVREVLELAPRGSLEFHVLGTFPGDPCEGVVLHGRYDRADFAALVEEIRPHVAALLSITPETWSHFVTEAWSMGLPVLASDLGAPSERIQAQGGGWLVPPNDAEETARSLLRIKGDPEELRRCVAEAVAANWDDTETMAARYAEVYRTVLRRSSTVH